MTLALQVCAAALDRERLGLKKLTARLSLFKLTKPRPGKVHLVLCNKTAKDVLFAEDFEEFLQRPGRFQVTHLLSRESPPPSQRQPGSSKKPLAVFGRQKVLRASPRGSSRLPSLSSFSSETGIVLIILDLRFGKGPCVSARKFWRKSSQSVGRRFLSWSADRRAFAAPPRTALRAKGHLQDALFLDEFPEAEAT